MNCLVTVVCMSNPGCQSPELLRPIRTSQMIFRMKSLKSGRHQFGPQTKAKQQSDRLTDFEGK